MRGNNNQYLQLHIIVFIWGFTAIIGKLISLDAVTLVWYRIFFTVISIFAFMKLVKIDYKLKKGKNYVSKIENDKVGQAASAVL